MLTQERLKEVLDYNESIGDFHWRIALSRNVYIGQLAGSLKETGYWIISIDGKSYPAHRLAWFYVHGKWTMVDHIDGKRWHNAIFNLREANHQQNACNREVVTSNSGIKGVYKRKDRYHAGIKINGTKIHLGSFKTLEEAKNARLAAVKEHFGEFANETEAQ